MLESPPRLLSPRGREPGNPSLTKVKRQRKKPHLLQNNQVYQRKSKQAHQRYRTPSLPFYHPRSRRAVSQIALLAHSPLPLLCHLTLRLWQRTMSRRQARHKVKPRTLRYLPLDLRAAPANDRPRSPLDHRRPSQPQDANPSVLVPLRLSPQPAQL
jgi:hypothetical protein